MTNPGNIIILCQPDSNKGCSACCGLFNLKDISKNNLTGYLNHLDLNFQLKEYDFSEDKHINRNSFRDITSHICSFQGFIGEIKPGCRVHEKTHGNDMRHLSLFGSKICGDFLCPAHYLLDDKQKDVLIRYIDDWYLYSIAIIDPESFIWIMKFIGQSNPDNSDDSYRLRSAISEALRKHADFLNGLEGAIFQYSVPEYNLNKERFSLKSGSTKMDAHRKDISDMIKSIIFV
jgi:hypothetical protein